MERLPELRAEDILRVNRAAAELSALSGLAEVESEFIRMATGLLPGDCVCWNSWTLDMKSVLGSRANEGYEARNRQYAEPLNALVPHHPVIAGGAFLETLKRPQRMSDFQSHAAFKENPLFREVYRHLDSHFQLGYIASTHATGVVALTWNRRRRDFSERERCVLHLIGRRLDVILRRIDERESLERLLGAFRPWVSDVTKLSARATLSPMEGRLLAGLMRGKSREEIAARLGCRRDTLDRRIAHLRERFGVENTGQLMSGLARLRTGKSERTRELIP